MNAALVIAKNTFKEAVRDKALYAILSFAIIFILLDLFLAELAIGDPVAVKSFGLAGVYVFGMLVTIFLGSSLIYREIERRTLYFVLSKPASRSDVIIGKFLGLLAAVALATLLMALVYLAVVACSTHTFDALGLLAILFQLMEEALFIALLIFFSSVAAPLTSTLVAFIVLLVGHLTPDALREASFAGGMGYKFVNVLYYVFPNLEKFNLRNLVVHNTTPPFSEVAFVVLYLSCYVALLLYCATLLFKRREL